MKKAFLLAALFVGTTIGAGFATGREIALFFGKSSPLSATLAGLVMALIGAVFLIAGKRDAVPKNNPILQAAVLFCSLCTLAAMIAGNEAIFCKMTALPLFGLGSALVGAVFCVKGTKAMKILNAVAVPAIVALIALLFFKNGECTIEGNFDVVKSVGYAGLNMLSGGLIIAQEGKKMDKKEIALYVVFVTVFMGAMLFMLQNLTLSDTNGSLMPVFEIATLHNLGVAVGVLIVLAIFTTLVSSLKLSADCMSFFAEYFAEYAKNKNTHLHRKSKATMKLKIGGAQQIATDLSTENKLQNEKKLLMDEANTIEKGKLKNKKNDDLKKKKNDDLKNKKNDVMKNTSYLICIGISLLIAYPLSFAGFDTVVDLSFPAVAATGVALCVWVSVKLICAKARTKKMQHV